MKKFPKGISNYEELINDGYYYVDKTMYIEKLESLSDKRIIYLRPRKFGKTLFTSILENYYDILKKEKFEALFEDTYIGKNPTRLKNSYHILKFNFSGIDTQSTEKTIQGFKSTIIESIKRFVAKYEIDFYVNENQDPEEMLGSLYTAFMTQKKECKIYVIIDEYDHFANELLGFNTDKFKSLVSQNGKVRKWYEVLKEGTETIVDRIFITGVAPITLDSLTSGFNIATDISRDVEFNGMVGFTKEELIQMMTDQQISQEEQDMLLPIMKENYDGYKFTLEEAEKIYNSNMCLTLLADYVRLGKLPRSLVDVNIASDYSKLEGMLEICITENKEEIIKKTLSREGIVADIVDKFNPKIGFGEKEFISMLYYLGYLTIDGDDLGDPILQIPNKIMKEIYSDFFLNLASKEANLRIESSDFNQMAREIAYEGRIDKITEKVHQYLNNLSNRDLVKFDEKYVKILFYSIVMNLNAFSVKSEMEVNRKYPDLLIVPKDATKGYNAVMIEFKYLKKDEKDKLKETQENARKQIKEYMEFEDIKQIKNLHSYTVIAVNDEIYVEKM